MKHSFEELREASRELALRDRHHDLLELLQDVPIETIRSDEDLEFWYVLSLLSIAHYAKAEPAAEDFIRRYRSSDDPLSHGRTHLLRSHLHIMNGNTVASYEEELKAVEVLPPHAYLERFRSWATIDTMAGHLGDEANIERAIEELRDVRNHLPFDQSWWYSFVIPNRADILAKRGFLTEAEQLLQVQLPLVPPAEAEIYKMRLASIALEKQEPGQASEWINEVAHDGPGSYWSMEAIVVASQVERLTGEPDRAIQILHEGLSWKTVEQVRAEVLRAQLQLCEIWIQDGQLALAEAWFDLAPESMDPWPRTFGHPTPNLILAQLKLAKAEHGEAIELLEELRDEGLRRKHNGLLVSIYAHLAYAHAGIGETEEATTNVQLAIEAGANGNFAKSMTVHGQDIRMLLSSTTGRVLSKEDAQNSAADMLSHREKEVLALVAEGKRNAEIADILFVSVNTVKNHLASVFRTLGATRRVDAVQIARQMGILGTVQEKQASGE